MSIRTTAIRRVACALSGGVDSAVSALLLKRHGFEVVGIHMYNWDERDERVAELGRVDEQRCSRTKEQADAEWVAQKLGIQLHVVDFVKDYWNKVFMDFLDSFKRGRCVVPDIACNQVIKFQLLHDFAMDPGGKIGADAVATGHYARKSRRPFPECLVEEERMANGEKNGVNQPTRTSPAGSTMKLYRGADPLKDQSYFLSTLTQAQLRRSIFPVGHLYKSQVRKIAMEAGLERVAEKKDSMGVCAVGKRKDFTAFLSNYLPPLEGEARGRFVVLHSNGVSEELPQRHSGVHYYNIGKRVSFEKESDYPQQDPDCCPNGDDAEASGEENGSGLINSQQGGLFVWKLDAVKQVVHLCRGSHHPLLMAKKFTLESPLHWICGMEGEAYTDVLLKRQAEHRRVLAAGKRPALPDQLALICQRSFYPVLCEIERVDVSSSNGGRATAGRGENSNGDAEEGKPNSRLAVIPQRPIRGVAPGQRCVFYAGDECLGSAEIHSVEETLADDWILPEAKKSIKKS